MPRKLKTIDPALPVATAAAADLALALALPCSVIDKRASIPVLKCVRLAFEKAELVIDGTDLDLAVSTTCKLHEVSWPPGAAAVVDAALLRAVVAAAGKDDVISLTLGETALLVRHKLERARLPLSPADEFPVTRPPEGDAVALTLDGEVLAAALGRVAPAISREETRYYLQGIHAAVDGKFLELTATDGHRLHHTRVEADDVAGEKSRHGARAVILPRRLVQLLLEATGETVLRIHEHGVVVAGELGLITSRVIDGTFPDWRRVVPPERGAGLELAAAELGGAANRVRVAGESDAIGLRFDAAGVSLQGANAVGEVVETEIAGVAHGDQPDTVETGLRARYLIEAAKVAGSGRVIFQWGQPGEAMRLTVVDRPDDLFVLMPMRMGAWREVAA